MTKLVAKNFLGQDMEFEDCKSCAISNHQITNLIGGYIYDDGFVNITADPEVPIVGFMVVGIAKHIDKLTKLSPIERYRIFEVINELEKIMAELGYEEVIKFEDGFSVHWREWVIPSKNNYFYNQMIGESDEKSKTKRIAYYEKYATLLLQCLIDKEIPLETYNYLISSIHKCQSYDELIELVRNTYGTKMGLIVEQLRLLNLNFGRGKNLKNITNYAKEYATEEEKNKVIEFAHKVKVKFDERRF